jgi:hypothetical protein
VGGRETKVSFAKESFFASTDGTFHALGPLKRGWVAAEGDETERDVFSPADWNVLPSYAGIHKLHKSVV